MVDGEIDVGIDDDDSECGDGDRGDGEWEDHDTAGSDEADGDGDDSDSDDDQTLAAQIVELDEFQRLLRLLHLDFSAELALQHFCAADRYGSGAIVFAEYDLALRGIIGLLTDEVVRSVGLAKLDQALVFLVQIVVVVALYVFIFCGTQAFHDGSTPGMYATTALPLLANGLVHLAESCYFESRLKRIGPASTMKQIDLAVRTHARKQ